MPPIETGEAVPILLTGEAMETHFVPIDSIKIDILTPDQLVLATESGGLSIAFGAEGDVYCIDGDSKILTDPTMRSALPTEITNLAARYAIEEASEADVPYYFD